MHIVDLKNEPRDEWRAGVLTRMRVSAANGGRANKHGSNALGFLAVLFLRCVGLMNHHGFEIVHSRVCQGSFPSCCEHNWLTVGEMHRE